MVGDEELGLVEDGELLLAVVALDDDGDLGRVLLADGLHVLDAKIWTNEKLYFYHVIACASNIDQYLGRESLKKLW